MIKPKRSAVRVYIVKVALCNFSSRLSAGSEVTSAPNSETEQTEDSLTLVPMQDIQPVSTVMCVTELLWVLCVLTIRLNVSNLQLIENITCTSKECILYMLFSI